MLSSFDLINQEVSTTFSNSFIKSINELNIDINKLKLYLTKISKLKILVIGDTIIDEYITCQSLGMSQG